MIEIREATVKDAVAASRIVRLCYEGFGKTEGFDNKIIVELKKRRGTAEHIAEFITNENFFVADDEQILKGMISIKDNEISKLYVDPHHQKQGIGRQLFAHAEDFIQTHCYDAFFVATVSRSAVSFYERMGMKISRRCRIDCGPCIGMTSVILNKKFGA